MTADQNRSQVKSVHTALDIIQYLHENPDSTLEDLSKSLETSTSTAHRHLSTLRDRGFILNKNNTYRLSLTFLTYGGKVRKELPAHEMIEQKIYQLAEQTSERTQFIVEEYGERVYAYTYAGQNAVKMDAEIGKRGPIHISAAGKAILAHSAPERVAEILSKSSINNLLTEREHEDLEEELQVIREHGYAFNDEESTEGLRAVGVPVMQPNNEVLGAISISGPAKRLQGEYFRNELPSLLLGTVNEIELNLQYL